MSSPMEDVEEIIKDLNNQLAEKDEVMKLQTDLLKIFLKERMTHEEQYKILIHAVDVTRGKHNGALNCTYLLQMIHNLGCDIITKKK